MSAIVKIEDLNEALPHLCVECQDKLSDLKTYAVAEERIIPPTLRQLFQLVLREARRADLTPEMLRSPCNRASRVKVRREIAVKARAMGYSFPEIGRALHRHHTTIVYLVKESR